MAKVFLSAGHGGSDPGATSNGLYEKTINLNTLLACRDELIRHGLEVVCSRTKDEYDPVSQEVKEANASGADVAVSFHANAASGKGDGFEAYYYGDNEKGKKLAQLCEKHITAIGQNSRGVKSTKSLYFVKNTTMTAVLVESFFVDNSNDRSIGDTTEKQKQLGVSYAKAILEYFGVSYKNNETRLTSATDIAHELNKNYFPIYEMGNFIKALDEAKRLSSPLYWGFYKLVNKCE